MPLSPKLDHGESLRAAALTVLLWASSAAAEEPATPSVPPPPEAPPASESVRVRVETKETGVHLYQYSEGADTSDKELVCAAPCGEEIQAPPGRLFVVELDRKRLGDPFALSGQGGAVTVDVWRAPGRGLSWTGVLLALGGAVALGAGAGMQGPEDSCFLCTFDDHVVGIPLMVHGGGMLLAAVPVLVKSFHATRPVLDVWPSGMSTPRFAGLALSPPLPMGRATAPAAVAATWSF